MTKRDVVRAALEFRTPPYVPWNFGFTVEAHEKLAAHYKTSDLEPRFDNHFFTVPSNEIWTDVGGGCSRDIFGVVWDRSVDKDIGVVKGCVLPEPTLAGFTLPDPLPLQNEAQLPALLEKNRDLFRIFAIGFSLYERAWTLRGMENLMVDFHENPRFVRDLLRAIAGYNLAQLSAALKYDFDGVYFGDDWGQQHGLQMGPKTWRQFIAPELKRMYGAVRSAGRFVFIHSCGDVDELFDDLVALGVNCFNPFQPEVMDVKSLIPRYHGRLAFHGGLSTQKTLPYGSADDVRRDVRELLALGRNGGYVFSPAHAVEGDVPLENLLAFIEEVQGQPGCP
jgi:uroporphyrinogen decarboxylase